MEVLIDLSSLCTDLTLMQQNAIKRVAYFPAQCQRRLLVHRQNLSCLCEIISGFHE